MTITSVAVTIAKFIFGMCDCTVDSDVGMGDFSLKEGICKCMDNRTFDRTCLRTWNLVCAIAQLIVMLVWGIFACAGYLHVRGRTHVRSHVSPGIN